MVLLDMLRHCGKSLLVLHVNYGLRGEASDQDERLVSAYCEQHRLELEVLRVDLYDQLKLSGGNLQQKAREVRYAFFEKHALPSDGIFLAHHLDDQIETFFLALTRGGGVRALSCMAEHRGKIFRPLLSYSKAELISYANENDVPWREDQSNQELSYARNKWRNVFLPEIQKVFPNLNDDILLVIKQFQLKLIYIQQKANDLAGEFNSTGKLPFEWMDTEFGEVVSELLRMNGFTHGVFAELQKLRHSDKGSYLDLVHCRYNRVFRETDHFQFMKDAGTELPIIVSEPTDHLPKEFDKKTIYLDPEKITGELKIRTWQNGDRIKPIGVNGSKLISDILSDAKVHAFEKSSQIVLIDDTKILWCVGFCVSREALATASSQKMKVYLKI